MISVDGRFENGLSHTRPESSRQILLTEQARIPTRCLQWRLYVFMYFACSP